MNNNNKKELLGKKNEGKYTILNENFLAKVCQKIIDIVPSS